MSRAQRGAASASADFGKHGTRGALQTGALQTWDRSNLRRLSDQQRIKPGGPMKVATPAQPMMFDDTAGPVFGHERR
jgi:hypothetical protein